MIDDSTVSVLRWMRIALHVSVAALLILAIVRAWSGDHTMAHFVWTGLLSILLAGCYLAGTVAELRRYRRTGRSSAPRLAAAWMLVIAPLWVLLVLADPAFAWLAFPLFFLLLHTLPAWGAGVMMAGMIALIGLTQPRTATGGFEPAAFIGPAAGAVVAVLISVFYRRLLTAAEHHRRALSALAAAQAELALSEHEAGRLEERNRLAADIHDTLAQDFSSILLFARALRSTEAEVQRSIAAIETTAASGLAQARSFFALDDAGTDLDEQIAAVCRRTQQAAAAIGSPLTVSFHHDGEPASAAPGHERVVLRAAQSLLSNVLRHAEARSAHVTVSRWPAAIGLDVVDDGRGFDPAAPGFGLAALHQRICAAGGTLTIESQPGHGAAVSLSVPLREAAHAN